MTDRAESPQCKAAHAFFPTLSQNYRKKKERKRKREKFSRVISIWQRKQKKTKCKHGTEVSSTKGLKAEC